MSKLVKICDRSELPPDGQAREIAIEGKTYCLAYTQGVATVMDNACPHRGGPLGQGLVEHGKLICPWHAWAFDLKTGQATHSPQEKVEVYPAKLSDDAVYAELK